MTYTAELKRFFIGAVIGVASMLPGVSGAVIAVCFGVYERLIEDIADLKNKLKPDFMFLLILGLGIVLGMGIAAVGLDELMKGSMVIALFFFLGLIVGQMPELKNLANEGTEKCSVYNMAGLIVGFVIMIAIMLLGVGENVDIEHNMFSFVCLLGVGIIFAVSKIAPGISGSTLLLALGLYQPMLNAVTGLDWFLITPMMIGLIIGLLGFAKVMNKAIANHRKSTYYTIIGLTLGSMVVILSYAWAEMSTPHDIVFGIVSMIIGIVVSLAFIRLGSGNEDI